MNFSEFINIDIAFMLAEYLSVSDVKALRLMNKNIAYVFKQPLITKSFISTSSFECLDDDSKKSVKHIIIDFDTKYNSNIKKVINMDISSVLIRSCFDEKMVEGIKKIKTDLFEKFNLTRYDFDLVSNLPIKIEGNLNKIDDAYKLYLYILIRWSFKKLNDFLSMQQYKPISETDKNTVDFFNISHNHFNIDFDVIEKSCDLNIIKLKHDELLKSDFITIIEEIIYSKLLTFHDIVINYYNNGGNSERWIRVIPDYEGLSFFNHIDFFFKMGSKYFGNDIASVRHHLENSAMTDLRYCLQSVFTYSYDDDI